MRAGLSRVCMLVEDGLWLCFMFWAFLTPFSGGVVLCLYPLGVLGVLLLQLGELNG